MRPLFIKSILASLSCRPLQKSLHLTACVILTMLLSACKDYYEEQSSYENNNSGQYYIKAQVTTDVSEMDVSTRSSNPTPDAPDGGEDGDGNEMGLENENNVKNLTVFLYQGEKNLGTAISNNVTLESEAFYFDDMSLTETDHSGKTQTWESKSYRKTSLPILTSTYNTLIVTNVGDVRSKYAGKTIKYMADDLLSSAWESAEGVAGVSGERATTSCNAFVMSNEQIHAINSKDQWKESTDEGGKTVKIPHEGTIEDPIPAFAKVERVAARIEFHIDNSSNGDIGTFFGEQTDVVKYNTTLGGYVYPAVTADTKALTDKKTDVSDIASGYFVLTHVLPYNCLKESSYLLKRVKDSENNISYLGTETTTGEKTGVANNWVLDPWTLSTDGHTESLYSNPLGTSVGDDSEALIKAFSDDLWSAYSYKETNFIDDDHKVIKRYTDGNYEYEKNQWRDILTYTMENTTLDNSVEHATGLLFRGKYYTKEEWNNGSPTEGAGTDKVYRYYIRHSDPTNAFQSTGIPSADKLKTATPMTYAIVRNNLYRVSIGKVIAPEKETEEPKLNIVLKVKPWTKYTHDEIEM